MKIAAGEVVTSPSSVVKELLENSIDAGADQITVEVKGGGTEEISIKDNGAGIPADEIEYSIAPHATSKIEKWDDILNLSSYGFRGEALASIASVSELYLSSKPEKQDIGEKIFARAGQVEEREPVVMKRGTQIKVRNLFYNVPARRKFLRAKTTESRYVLETVEKFILSNPEIAFTFLRDSKEVYRIRTDDIFRRIQRVYKNIDADQLVRMEHRQGDFGIYGAVSTPELNRPNRTGIVSFVNGRYVKDPVVYAVIKEFFTPIMPRGRFPVAVIFLDIPRNRVDINVHPQKLEIKYSDSGAVYRLIKNGLKSAYSNLSLNLGTRSSGQTEPTGKVSEDNVLTRPVSQKKTSENTVREDYKTAHTPLDYKKANQMMRDIHEDFSKISEKQEKQEKQFPQETSNDHRPKNEKSEKLFSDIKIIGIANRRYIIVETENKLELIDFHAAHERVLFEKLKRKEKKLISQKFLDNISIDSDETGLAILREKKERFTNLGFDYSIRDGKVLVSGVPNIINLRDVETVFKEILDELRLIEFEPESKVFDSIYATIACHNAYRTGDFVTSEEAIALIKEMRQYEVFSCPHGRPVRYSLTFSELDAFFNRK